MTNSCLVSSVLQSLQIPKESFSWRVHICFFENIHQQLTKITLPITSHYPPHTRRTAHRKADYQHAALPGSAAPDEMKHCADVSCSILITVKAADEAPSFLNQLVFCQVTVTSVNYFVLTLGVLTH